MLFQSSFVGSNKLGYTTHIMDYSQYKQIDFRRKFFKLLGAEISLTATDSQAPIGVIKMKAWKLREDIRLYAADGAQEVVRIAARQIIDFGATYDVFDSTSNQQLFSFKRKGLRSTFVRDYWKILDTDGNEIGSIQETSSVLALARRWLEIVPFGDLVGLIFSFIAQTYTISLSSADGQNVIGTIVHQKNPVIVKMHLDTSVDTTSANPLIAIAAVSLLSVVDASKNS